MAQPTTHAVVRGIPLVCPSCHEELEERGDSLRCTRCGREYPLIDGRPAFVISDGAWSPPAPSDGRWLRRHLASPPHGVRLAGQIRDNDHRYLREFLRGIPDDAKVLDLGSGERRLRPGIVNLDIVGSPAVDVIADGHQLPFHEGAFDAVVLQSVIEHVLEPEKMLAESCRVLRPGGQIWVEAPFQYPIHDPSDYYRWTLAGLRYIVSKHFDVIRSGALIGPASALNLNWRVFVNWKLRRVHWGVRNAVAWATSWLKLMDPNEPIAEPPESYALSYVLGVKPL